MCMFHRDGHTPYSLKLLLSDNKWDPQFWY